MAYILECSVTGETTGQLRQRVEDAIMRRHGILSMVLLPETEVPQLEPVPVSMRIQRASHTDQQGGESVSGTEVLITGEKDGVPVAEDLPTTVNIYLEGAPDLPPTASVTMLD